MATSKIKKMALGGMGGLGKPPMPFPPSPAPKIPPPPTMGGLGRSPAPMQNDPRMQAAAKAQQAGRTPPPPSAPTPLQQQQIAQMQADSKSSPTMGGVGKSPTPSTPYPALRIPRPPTQVSSKKFPPTYGPSILPSFPPELNALYERMGAPFSRKSSMKKGGDAKKYTKGGKINLDACSVSTHTKSKKSHNW